MSYYIAKKTDAGFDEAVDIITAALKAEGFGILTDIDVAATLKKKLDVDFKKYRILGACNPPFAYKALQTEDKIGVMLPCNVIVQEKEDGTVEVAAINPMEAMASVGNEGLQEVAETISGKLQNALNRM